jgi:hypothetical protein
MTPGEAHGPTPEAKLPPPEDVAKASAVLTVLVILYWVVSELSHLFLPRNFIPVP